MTSGATLRLRDSITLAAVAALAAATVHVGALAVDWFAGRMAGYAREFSWIAPLGYLIWLGPLALLLWALGTRWRALASARVQVSVLGAVLALSALLHIGGLHPLSLLVLAVGMGSALGSLAGRDGARAVAVARRVGMGLALFLLVVGLPGTVGYRWRQWREAATLPAAREGAPNVILLILDTVRAANLSVYGYGRRTSPSLERIASEGVLFESAMSTAPWTAPSHASLLTGRYPFTSGIAYLTPMADSMPTVTEAFRAAGYGTGAFVGNAFYAGRVTGFDRGFLRYDDYPVSWGQLWWSANLSQADVTRNVLEVVRSRDWGRLPRAVRRSTLRIIGEHRGDRYDAATLVERFLGWRDGLGGRPFFAMINFFDAHSPYETPTSARFAGGARAMDRYDGSIVYADSMVGALLDGLQARGALDNTIVVVVADHGEHFGEHGLFKHGNSLFLELLHVPLLIRAPGRVPAGSRVGTVVSTRDVPATLLDLAGLTYAPMVGTSLAPLWSGGDAGASSPALAEAEQPYNQFNRWPTSYGPMKAHVTDAHHFIRRGDGREWIYRWRGDTTGRGDATATDSGAAALVESRARLRDVLGPRWTERGVS